MLEKSSSGPGVSLAASIVKCGKVHTGQLKTVSSGLSSATRRASLVASTFVHTGPLARTTSCPDSSSAEAIRSSIPRANLSMSRWTPSLPSDMVRMPTRAIALDVLPVVHADGPARAAYPQLEVEYDLSRLVPAAADPLEEKLHGALRHPADGLGQGRERGIHELRPERVVYGHERHVLRHPEPPASERPQNPDGHEVIRHHQGRGRPAPQQLPCGTLAAVDPVAAVRPHGFGPGPSHGVFVASQAVCPSLRVGRSADETHPLVTRA